MVVKLKLSPRQAIFEVRHRFETPTSNVAGLNPGLGLGTVHFSHPSLHHFFLKSVNFSLFRPMLRK